jgi:hypothetical protein
LESLNKDPKARESDTCLSLPKPTSSGAKKSNPNNIKTAERTASSAVVKIRKQDLKFIEPSLS